MVVSGQQIDFTVINFCTSKNSLSASRWLAGSNHSLVEEKKIKNLESRVCTSFKSRAFGRLLTSGIY